jgi:hypothetical protein
MNESVSTIKAIWVCLKARCPDVRTFHCPMWLRIAHRISYPSRASQTTHLLVHSTDTDKSSMPSNRVVS